MTPSEIIRGWVQGKCDYLLQVLEQGLLPHMIGRDEKRIGYEVLVER
jgi:hypothetical protein